MSKPTIFLSHSSADEDVLKSLSNKLREATGNSVNIFLACDGSSIPFGQNSPDWPGISRQQLMDEPFCLLCELEGETELAADVDHLLPRAKGGGDESSNIWSLCKMHHARKTVQEQLGLDVEHWREHRFSPTCERCIEIVTESRILRIR